MFAFYGCEKKSKDTASDKATEETVLKYLPGTWKVTQKVDESGAKTSYEDEAIFEFGKQEDESDFSVHDDGSSLWGYCTITVNGENILTNGFWNIEPSQNGVLIYCQRGKNAIEFEGNRYYHITSISSSSMRWETSDDQSGLIFSRK